MNRRLVLGAALLLTVGFGAPRVEAQEGNAPPPPCAGEEHRQFDFWVGSWEVKDANGSLQGHNRIDSILGGCVLQEHWQGISGSIGQSYNAFDRQTGQWHQTWVDNGGTVLKIDGGLDGNAMVLHGTGTAGDGASLDHKITWTPLEDGRVKQHWQSSRDGGETWSDLFVGFYSRDPAAE